MNKTNDFKYNLPAYSDPVDIEDLNDNFRGIDDALMAGLCKKDYTGNNMGSSDPSARKYAWAPWLEIVNDNEFDVVVTDRNAPVGSEEATINIAAGQTFRKYINGRYYMNFYVQDQHDVTFKWFTNAETYINESGGGGGGTGTVTSVSVQGGSGSHLTASGNPIETSGTITINVDEGYSIPSDNEQTAWDGKAADLKLEINSSTYVITAQLKDASGNLIGNERTIDLPLESVVVSGTYDDQTKKVILTLQNGSTIEFSVADLVSGLQTELNDTDNKLDPDYIDYDSTHRAVTDTEKDTWNGKQNALTFDDTPTQNSNNPVKSGGVYSALTGKQASLDSTQLTAVNSGIDSTKVGQISTNQTNILSVNEISGGLNKCQYNSNIPNWSGVTIDITKDAIKMTGTASSSYTGFIYSGSSADEGYITNLTEDYICVLFGTAQNVSIMVQWMDSTDTMRWDNIVSPKTIPTGAKRIDGIYIQRQSTATATINVNANVLLCKKRYYDAGFTSYVPYALPNYDLTRLESEDRASLAEVVDSGAKNEFQITQASTTGYTVNSDGTVTASGALSNSEFNMGNFLTGTLSNLVLSGCSGGSSSTYCLLFQYRISGGNVQAIRQYDDPVVINLTNVSWSALYVEVKSLSAGQTKVFKPMLCTKAAFGVSNKFVPYRLPLSDNTWVKSADLFPSHRTEFDVNNSHVYTYTNEFLNKVVVSIELKAASAISSATGVLSIASNIANIPPKTLFYDINDIVNNFECVILKNNANGSLAFKVTTGTMSSGTTFNAQFEYTYGLN